MQSVLVFRLALLPLILSLISACAPSQPAPLPEAASQPANIVMALPALLAEPQRWSGQPVTVITPVYEGETRVLTLPPPSESSDIVPERAIWLAQPLPEAVRQALAEDSSIVKLHGTLSPPGAYGRDQRFTYQFVADQATVVSPERTTIANLALNPQALNQVLLLVEGTLLADADAALLVDEVGAGGVPKAGGYQIKLSRASLDPALLTSLTTAGPVRWGPVAIVGWWQNGVFTPLATAEASGSAAPSGNRSN